MSALLGTFVNIKTMSDGTPRITLDLQCTLAEVAALGLMPGIPFGIARITGASTIAPIEPEPIKEKVGMLCIMACTFCKDPEFWKWSMRSNEDDAKNLILKTCGIQSRKELDALPYAAKHFHEFIRLPFMAWKAAQ